MMYSDISMPLTCRRTWWILVAADMGVSPLWFSSEAGDADAVLPSVAETKRLQNLLPGDRV